MPFEISSRVTRNLNNVQRTPAIVVLFDGISTEFTSVVIKTWYRLDDGHILDDGLFLDRTAALSSQETVISFGGGSSTTTTKIDYKIDPDLGIGDSITTMKIALVNDKKNTILNVIRDNELLGRKVRVKMTPDATTAVYPQDYFTIFRGIVDEVTYEAGMVMLSVSHPDQKKRQTIFIEHTTTLSEAITNSQTTIPVENAAGFYAPIVGPDSLFDVTFLPFIRIDNEIIYYGDLDLLNNELQDCIRGELDTSAVAHDAEAEVTSYYLLQENPLNLALKMMLSGWNDYFVSDISISSFVAPNFITFDKDIFDEYGLTVGDYVTTTLATNGVNNDELLAITSISYDELQNITTIGLDTAAFIAESGSSAVAAFRSRYDTLPSGLRMTPDEVDVLGHEELNDWFLSTSIYTFYIKNTIDNAKDFITKEIYQPIACYAVPKNAKAGVGYTIPPLPDQTLKTLNRSNVKVPEKIKHFRQIGRNFYNSILYKYDEDQLEDAFNNGLFLTNEDSRAQIPVGNKIFTITSKGLRSGNVASSAAQRRLYRYKLAAAQLQGVKTLFSDGFNIDIGDNILFDGDDLMIPSLAIGSTTDLGVQLYQVIQKSIDLKTGDVTLALLDTNFLEASRYGYISPSSLIESVTSDREFVIETSYSAEDAEYNKWSRFTGASIQVRNTDFSITATGVIEQVFSDNRITLVNDLAVTPSAGMIMEFSDYDPQGLALVKTLYTHITDGSASFADGGDPYYMI